MKIKKLLLQFPREIANEPLVYRLAKEYNLKVNIFRAKIDPDESGYLVLDIYGSEHDIERGMQFIRDLQITINEKTTGLQWDKNRCTECGSCIPHCPTGSLFISDFSTMKVSFSEENCIECLNCVNHCPFGACSSVFGK